MSNLLNYEEVIGEKYLAISAYQRDYSWGKKECKALLEDVFDLQTNEEKKIHYIGQIIVAPYDENFSVDVSINFKVYHIKASQLLHIVDGQQRLVTILLILVVILNLINEDSTISRVFVENMTNRIKRLLFGSNYDVNSFPAPKLILQKDTGKCLQKDILKISDEEYNNTTAVSKIKKAFSYIRNEIIVKCAQEIETFSSSNSEQFYKKLLENLFSKIQFGYLECPDFVCSSSFLLGQFGRKVFNLF